MLKYSQIFIKIIHKYLEIIYFTHNFDPGNIINILMKQDLTLFNASDFEARKPANQRDFETNNSKLLCSFPGMVDMAFDRLNREIYPIIDPGSRDKNMPATIISGFLKGAMIRSFPHLCRKATPKRFRLKIDGSEWIYIKKLNDNKQPSNIKTKDNEKIMNQLSDSKTDVEANIFLGYTANQEMTQADGVFAVYIVGEKVEWFSDLRDLVSKENENVKQLSTPVETALKEGTVKIKPKQVG